MDKEAFVKFQVEFKALLLKYGMDESSDRDTDALLFMYDKVNGTFVCGLGCPGCIADRIITGRVFGLLEHNIGEKNDNKGNKNKIDMTGNNG